METLRSFWLPTSKPRATVVTVDLPPDFSVDGPRMLAYADGELNLTPRNQLGRHI